MDIKKLYYQSKKIKSLILEIKALTAVLNRIISNGCQNIDEYNADILSDMLSKRVNLLSKIFEKHYSDIDIAEAKQFSA